MEETGIFFRELLPKSYRDPFFSSTRQLPSGVKLNPKMSHVRAPHNSLSYLACGRSLSYDQGTIQHPDLCHFSDGPLTQQSITFMLCRRHVRQATAASLCKVRTNQIDMIRLQHWYPADSLIVVHDRGTTNDFMGVSTEKGNVTCNCWPACQVFNSPTY
jgi:hypothetical protein